MKNVLVLGAYGLIGSACVAALKRENFRVTGIGRSSEAARRSGLQIEWIIEDITDISVESWRHHLAEIDIVINAAGALQDGAGDQLSAIHDTAIAKLCEAAAGKELTLVQISAAGVSETAPTEFFRSKARGDGHVQASDLDWVILRPSLVIGRNAYGGTALLRGAAGFPGVGVRVFEGSPVQTIGLNELADAVVACASGNMPMRQVFDLTEPDTRSFPETVSLVRDWLGFRPFLFHVRVPGIFLKLIGLMADGLGWLGWRSPLRATALRTIADGITASPENWRLAGGSDFQSLSNILASMPATLQERWFARLYLLLPLSIGLLSIFWLVSGFIGLWQFDRAVEVMTERGFDIRAGQLTVISGSVADILLGTLVLYRPWAKRACLGMMMLAIGYMVGATVFAPDLWGDPLGPMVKVLPSIGLAFSTFAMLEER